jgi:type I restriction enzyme M protein
MLNSDTKRKIDSARDILVGKIPVPTAQVEQITLAMVYKFMSDIDKKAKAAGEAQGFFANGYDQYAWDHFIDKSLSAPEKLKRYSEGLEKMSLNPHIPQLFRDIFRDAYLPFRDPEVLKLFLEQIDGFTYDHSEELGNAFEYLLQVMGSQGDAGQFRTPRHIIDFIVACVEPNKNDRVLDPACGTAGFLISAYKYLVEKGLTATEKAGITSNFTGYDISHEMVRLSRVNMYLHHFPNPNIIEYDTLSDLTHWDEEFDTILANPPFMSPKGGVRPHNKFQIQAKRSEVLFVDYILEHLSPSGKAGVIVPEGIIFKSEGACASLRKALMETGLYAVVSLPSGVFNPYAGVKTSILLIDKALATKTDSVLFVKILSDGFDLGAQRRPIQQNDLPGAIKEVLAYKQLVKTGEATTSFTERVKKEHGVDSLAVHDDKFLLVKKSQIKSQSDVNLSFDRYKPSIITGTSNWPMVEIGSVCTFDYGKPLKDADREGGEYPVYGSNGIVGWHNKYLVEGPFIVVGRKGSAGAVTYSETSGYPIDTTFFVTIKDKTNLDLRYIHRILLSVGLDKINTQAGVPGLNRNDAYKIKIPLPPMEDQERIVAELDGYQQIIDAAKKIVSTWKPKIDIDPKWERVKLGSACEIKSGGTPPTSKREYYNNGAIPWLKSESCKNQVLEKPNTFISNEGLDNSSAKWLPESSTLIALVGATIGKTAFITFSATTNQNVAGLFPKDLSLLDPYYLFLASQTLYERFLSLGDGGFKMANLSFVKELEIYLPPIDMQKHIVAQIENEQLLVEGNKKLIDVYDQKIKDAVARVWGE